MEKTYNFSKKTDPKDGTKADIKEDMMKAKKSMTRKHTMGKQKK